jgi:hypothetical protein
MDNVAITAGVGTSIATDEVSGVHYQKVKLAFGASDAATLVSGSDGLPVNVLNASVAITAAALPLPSGAATAANQATEIAHLSTLAGAVAGGAVVVADGGGALTVDGTVGVTGTVAVSDGSGSLTVDNGGTFAVQASQTGTWAVRSQDGSGNALSSRATGSSRPLEVAILDASGNQVTSFGGSGGTASNFGSAVPSTGTAAGYSDGTNMQSPRVFDADSGGGTQYVLGVSLRKAASGGSAELGTSTDPIRIDPTGATTQPVSLASVPSHAVTNAGTFAVQAAQSGSWTVTANAGSGTLAVSAASLPLPTGAATESTLSTLNGKVTACNTGAVTVSAALPAGTNLLGRVSTSVETSTAYDGTTALTPKFAAIAASSSGDNTVVAAVTSKKIRVLRWDLTGNGNVNAKWKSGASTDKTGLYYLTQYAGCGGSYCPVGLFETAAGEALVLNLSGAVAVGGVLTYLEV